MTRAWFGAAPDGLPSIAVGRGPGGEPQMILSVQQDAAAAKKSMAEILENVGDSVSGNFSDAELSEMHREIDAAYAARAQQ